MVDKKRTWLTIFCAMVLAAVLYVPFHVSGSGDKEYFMGYGFIFARESVGLPPKPAASSNSGYDGFMLAKWEESVQKTKRVQKMMTVDYNQVLLEIVGAAAICGIGYIITVSKKQTSD